MSKVSCALFFWRGGGFPGDHSRSDVRRSRRGREEGYAEICSAIVPPIRESEKCTHIPQSASNPLPPLHPQHPFPAACAPSSKEQDCCETIRSKCRSVLGECSKDCMRNAISAFITPAAHTHTHTHTRAHSGSGQMRPTSRVNHCCETIGNKYPHILDERPDDAGTAPTTALATDGTAAGQANMVVATSALE